MKHLLLLLALVIPISSSSAFDHSPLDSVLKQYVDGTGMVNYKGLKADRAGLDSYLETTGAVSKSTFSNWSENERLTFLINVYNAETLQFIIDNYPVASIKKLGGFLSSPWDKKNVRLFGDDATLNQLEHKIIRKDFDEPRIHFALVCAANGCPPLRNEAFTATRLDAQLTDQTKVFLSQKAKNRIEGDTVFLSPIFKWYKEDFTKNGRTLQQYIAPFIPADPSGKDIEYTEYDWSLNER